MQRRQTRVPVQWLITDQRIDANLTEAIRQLPVGSGILVRHHHLRPRARAQLLRRIRNLAVTRRLEVVDEKQGRIVRVHDSGEVRIASLAGARLLFLSPLYPTRSHPDWKPLPRTRAAALVRLAKVPVIALGGMNARRFAKVRNLGFAGWAGVGAWEART